LRDWKKFLSHIKRYFTYNVFVVVLFNQRLAGATLLVFANKQDLPGALSAEEIRDVSHFPVTNIRR